MIDILKETNFDFLGPKKVGKVRDIYEQEKQLILVATDRHSSFDRIIAHIPRKGEVLNRISAFWFEQTKDIVPNHFLAMPDPNVTIGRKCKSLPVEAVVRGFLTGVTSTSIWTHYQAGKRDFGNFTLPDGMKKNQRFDKPVFTPSTKADDHDRTLSPQEMVEEGIIEAQVLEKIEEKSLQLFERGQQIAAKKGLILADTKYEFGLDDNGTLTLIDEIHTPDSSRWWYLDSYEERFGKGEEPIYFDKEFLRLWFKDHCDPYKDAVLPEAPLELIEELSRRYQTIYHDLTGEDIPVLSGAIIPRIEKNLKQYTI
ncbi:phosphoribosylaminoimidazolesuccinocarboxamide synthase [Candidatus Kaiserbacteria bacterium]|nr:phosphoribosylaminoimidazolesuccinocarboxamide synthase [Candidatus Kaiserbacteria bacterium]